MIGVMVQPGHLPEFDKLLPLPNSPKPDFMTLGGMEEMKGLKQRFSFISPYTSYLYHFAFLLTCPWS